LEVDRIQNPSARKLDSNTNELASNPNHMSLDDFVNQTIDRHLERIAAQLDAISQNPTINLDDTIRALEIVVAHTSEKIEQITPSIPEIAPILWQERGKENRFMSPFEFIKIYYPSYGFGLTLPDIKHLDSKLYVALMNWKNTKGWPEDFKLPSINEIYDAKLQSMNKHQLQQILKLADVIRYRNVHLQK